MTTLKRIREVLKNNEEYLRSIGFTEVGVFGSYVRGQETPQSDVDILLSRDSNHTIGNKLPVYSRLSGEFGDVAVDIAIKDLLYPKLQNNILAEVEYVIGSKETLAHNSRRDMQAIMTQPKDYTVPLDHIIEAMQKGMKSVQDITYKDFIYDEKERVFGQVQIQNIGDAAKRLPESLRKQYSYLNIPWKDMIGMRNAIVHEYDNIDYPAVWETLTKSVPQTLPKIQEMHRSEERRM